MRRTSAAVAVLFILMVPVVVADAAVSVLTPTTCGDGTGTRARLSRGLDVDVHNVSGVEGLYLNYVDLIVFVENTGAIDPWVGEIVVGVSTEHTNSHIAGSAKPPHVTAYLAVQASYASDVLRGGLAAGTNRETLRFDFVNGTVTHLEGALLVTFGAVTSDGGVPALGTGANSPHFIFIDGEGGEAFTASGNNLVMGIKSGATCARNYRAWDADDAFGTPHTSADVFVSLSGPYEAVRVWTSAEAPSPAPSPVTLRLDTHGPIASLTWNYNYSAEYVENFEVYRNGALVKVVPNNIRAWRDPVNLGPGQAGCYTVKAVTVETIYTSNEQCATGPTPPPRPPLTGEEGILYGGRLDSNGNPEGGRGNLAASMQIAPAAVSFVLGLLVLAVAVIGARRITTHGAMTTAASIAATIINGFLGLWPWWFLFSGAVVATGIAGTIIARNHKPTRQGGPQ